MSTSSSSFSTPQAQGHPSRRDNQSVSSVHSRASERSRSSHSGTAQVEPAVTRLLVSIKQLLEALTLWSSGKMDENQVSDVYVRLGNDFNVAVAAFTAFEIDMNELLSVPDDLRGVLEQCLSEDATPANLEVYLPQVRQIITSLLQGLRTKQSTYRRITSERKHRTTDSQSYNRESRTNRTSRADSASSVNGSSRVQRTVSAGDASSLQVSTNDSRQRRVASSSRTTLQQPPQASQIDDGYFAGGFVPSSRTPSSNEQRQSSHRREFSRSSQTPRNAEAQDVIRSRSATPSSPQTPDDPNDNTLTLSPKLPAKSDQEAPPVPRVPANITRYSLTDNPVPSVVVDSVTPLQSSENIASIPLDRKDSSTSTTTFDTVPEAPPLETQTPVIASSLAALKKSEALERRASKRFSSYNIQKMTGVGSRDRSNIGRGINRRSMAADASNISPGDLNVLTEEDESGVESKDVGRPGPSRLSRTTTPIDEDIPPIPPLPSASSSLGPPPSSSSSLSSAESRVSLKSGKSTEDPDPPSSNTLTVFLQLNREVKKVTIEKGLSFMSLRVLFVDKFSYNPGQDNFPDIYIRDPSSGVMYELEDVDEVRDKCLLSLNIDPLDQIKQHIDQQVSGIAQELKELKSTVGTSRRMSQLPQAPILTHPFGEVETSVVRPSDKQFQRVARRLSRMVTTKEEGGPPSPQHPNGLPTQMTGSSLQPQWTGGSILSEASGRIVTDLKNQFDEVQNLRRDLGVMRQLYLDFMSQTKESLNTLRTQTQTVRELSRTKVAGTREFVEAGKASLDSRSQNVLTRIEDLQDSVENLKADVLKRFVSPRSQVVKTVEKDIAEVKAELQGLKEYVSTVKPMWKKTWEKELQNIVEEQQFLNHEEEFIQDMVDDYAALAEVFGHVSKVIALREEKQGSVRTRGVRLPPSEENSGGISSVMMEIRTAQVDPEKRMKAIAQSQKNREREMAARSNEFEAELKNFVSGKKLKLTGGAEETERMRQKRNDMTLKAMFNGTPTTDMATTPTLATFSVPENPPS